MREFQKEGKNQRNEHTKSRELRHKYYGTTEWRKCRMNHLMKEPLCRRCLENYDRIFAGSDDNILTVHHIKSPFNYRKMTCDMDLLLDDDNLMTLCAKCHGEIHDEEREEAAKRLIKELDDLLL